MSAWLDELGATLLDATIAAILISTACVLVMVACRQPARRCLVARTALCGLLAVLPLSAMLDRPRWDLGRVVRRFAPPVSSSIGQAAGRLGEWLAHPTVGRSLAVLYLVTLAIATAWLLLGVWASRRLIGRAHPPTPELQSFYESLLSGQDPVPELRVSPRVRGPVLLGARRPVILVPPHYEEGYDQDAVRLAILHEIVHARRRDPGFSVLGEVAGACWAFLPMLWWIRAQMRLDQELLTDLTASDRFGSSGGYAGSLVDLASREAPASAPFRGKPAEATPLVLRVLMLVRSPFPVERVPPARWRVGVPSVVLAWTFLASGLSLRGAGAPPSDAQDSNPPGLHGTFRLGRLEVGGSRQAGDEKSAPYTLMCPLPDRCTLTLDVWAAPADLPAIRVIGRPLGPVDLPPREGVNLPGFRKVRIQKAGREVRVWVDDLPVEPLELPAPLPAWLTVQTDPGVVGLFRNLVLTW